MGRRPSSDLTFERIDNDGDYKPSNWRWATRKDQARNRRSTKLIEYKGETKSLAEWCESLGLSHRYREIHYRLKVGKSVEDAFTMPFLGRGKWKR